MSVTSGLMFLGTPRSTRVRGFPFRFTIYFFKLPALFGLLFLAVFIIVSSYRWHFKKEEESRTIETFSLKNITDANTAVKTSFEQTGIFLKEISDTLGVCFESAFSEDRHRLKDIKSETDKIQKWANVIVANVFKTLFLLNKEDVSNTQKYSHTIRALQAIAESHRDIITRIYEHFENFHQDMSN